MNVKVMNITNLENFFGVIEQCEEKVELVTHSPSDSDKIIRYMMSNK